jgi:DNA-binding MarR family transcriptional regulator
MLVREILDCINSILTIAQHEVYLKFIEALEPFGITPGQYDVLSYIWLHDDEIITPKSLANFLRLESGSVSGILDRM